MTRNRLGDGRPEYCDNCGTVYREVRRLPGFRVGYCPRCFEKVLNDEI